jgi:hypothetical protein
LLRRRYVVYGADPGATSDLLAIGPADASPPAR